MDDLLKQKLEELGLDEFARLSVTIDVSDMNREYAELAGRLTYFGGCFAAAKEMETLKEQEYKRTHARVWLESRDVAPPKTTVDDIKAMVLIDDRVMAAETAFREAERAARDLQVIVEAIRVKKDALISLGAQIRAEMDADPCIRDRLVEKQRLTELTQT